nr:immunoglobulin light chain junction region [Macaca mulatta]MPO03876.1 immunoglobulin light chain junction region [Macaca mulatta]MPO04158.1 immunoglobulin light chain junction region [Macaca mulatta]MPO04303.1 immunoglobulin light chain junction region [Macaca mulatta]MPO05144.1 immunoglobulin light chain junction region [Macaca mulatta]
CAAWDHSLSGYIF